MTMTPAEIKALVERLEARETCSCGICDGTVLVNPDGPEAATMLRSFMDGGWRPIETAPRDGTWFLAVWNDSRLTAVSTPAYGVIMWDGDEWREADDIVSEPTHWLPLPTPPAVEGEAGE